MKSSFLKILVFAALMSGCSTPQYQPASLKTWGGHQGYLEEKIGPGAYILEYMWQGGYAMVLKHEDSAEKLKSFWKQRAMELCPNGYTGEPEMIFAYQARIREFYTDRMGVNEFPSIASGKVRCRSE